MSLTPLFSKLLWLPPKIQLFEASVREPRAKQTPVKVLMVCCCMDKWTKRDMFTEMKQGMNLTTAIPFQSSIAVIVKHITEQYTGSHAVLANDWPLL